MSDFKLLSANAFNLDKSKVLSFGKELLKMIVLNQIPKRAFVSTCLLYMPFENTVGKGEIARNEQFLLFPQCFLYL